MFSKPSEIIKQCGVSEGSIVGDFGVGSGAYAREVATLVGEHGVVYAFDVQKDLIMRLVKMVAEEKLLALRPLWVDLEAPRGTKLENDVLDLAIVANTLFQIENKEGFLHEVYRVLRPGGRVLLVDWKESYGHMGPHPTHVVSEANAKRLLTDVGFVMDRTIDAGAHHYGFIARKNI